MNRFRILLIAVALILVGLATAAIYLSICLGVRRPVSELDESLNAPESVERVRTVLAKVNSQVNTLPLGDSQSDEVEMIKLSAAVYRRAIEHPELPEVWITAATAINRRSWHETKLSAPTCGEEPNATPRLGIKEKFESVAFATYKDCEISLDRDVRAIKRHRRNAANDSTINVLELRRVHVTYRGGPFPLIATLACVQCTFDLQSSGIPSPRGKSFIRALLTTYSENFAIEISNGT